MAPERSAAIESCGIRLHCAEWGDPAAPPVVLLHGMFDHVRGFASLAPLLAQRFRVIAVDARGHGDSGWAAAYSWPLGILDVVNVLRWLDRPAHLIGHSKGGGQAIDAAGAAPELVRQIVNIDGFGPPPFPDGDAEQLPVRFGAFLDQQRAAAQRQQWRPYARLEDLMARRQAQNPRLDGEWLRYFVYHAARAADDGWRWKSDPFLVHDFGPWQPDWIAVGYSRLRRPMLAVIGSEPDTWGPLPEEILAPRLELIPQLQRATIAGAGHFVHMERPLETAALILEYLER